MTKKETFKAARHRILDALRANGWSVNETLVIPTARSPRMDRDGQAWEPGMLVLRFRSQAIYLDDSSGGHSLVSDMRGQDVTWLVDMAWQQRKAYANM